MKTYLHTNNKYRPLSVSDATISIHNLYCRYLVTQKNICDFYMVQWGLR